MIISKLIDSNIISNEMLLIIACTLVIGYWIYQSILKYLSPLHRIPEPRRYWLLNHLPYFLKAKDELDLYMNWAEQFKEHGMFKIETLSGPAKGMVVLLKSEYVKTVLTKSDMFTKTKFLKFFSPLLGNGLVTATGQQHRFQKKFFMKSFSMAQMKYYLPVFNKHAGILTEIWETLIGANKDGKNLVLTDYFKYMGLDIIGEISFGYNFNSQQSKLDEYGVAVLRNSQGILGTFQRALLLTFSFLWYLPFGPANETRKVHKKCSIFLDKVISNRKQLMKEGVLTETQKNDWLTLMLEDQDGFFDHQQVKDSAFTFLIAGHDTSAVGLSGVLFYLAKFPHMQEEVREEINDKMNGIKSLEDMEELNKLSYTDAFIKESLRLFSPAPFSARIAQQDYKFGNYSVPKGTGVFVARHLLHEFGEFERGKEFLPRRWLCDELKRGTFQTFGYGPRACIGKYFALLQIKVVVVHLLKKFKFTIDPECEKFHRRVELLLRVSPDIKVRVHPLLKEHI